MDRTTLRMNHSAAVFPSFVTASNDHENLIADSARESMHRDGGGRLNSNLKLDSDSEAGPIIARTYTGTSQCH
jgi:hypothetical protein